MKNYANTISDYEVRRIEVKHWKKTLTWDLEQRQFRHEFITFKNQHPHQSQNMIKGKDYSICIHGKENHYGDFLSRNKGKLSNL
jgi:hypothetical protein